MFVILSVLSSVPYYYNPKIHSLGNVGFGGKIHAFTAPFARRMIDHISYKGVNIRKDISLQAEVFKFKYFELCE